MPKLAWLLLAVLPACAIEDPPPDVGTADQPLAGGHRPWPTDEIHYYIDLDGDVADTSQGHCADAANQAVGAGKQAALIQAVHDGFARVSTQTPLSFVELTKAQVTKANGPVIVITIGAAGVSGAPPGTHSGGVVTVNADGSLADDDWMSCIYMATPVPTEPGTYQHELGHEMGFNHEQRRSDRDTWLVYDGECASYKPADYKDSDDDLWTPFDPASVMEYPSDGDCNCRDASGTCLHPPRLIQREAAPNFTSIACRGDASDGQPGGCQWIVKAGDFTPDDINAYDRVYEKPIGTVGASDQMAAAVAVGDLDHDGYDDLAIGVPGAPGGGEVLLWKGTEGRLVAWKALKDSDLGGAASGDRFGAAVAIGDSDGDGTADLLVGAPGRSVLGVAVLYRGQSSVGARTGPSAQTVFYGFASGSQFGAAVAIGGGDSSHHRFVAMGAPAENGAGVVHVYDLVTSSYTTLTGSATGFAPASGDRFGAVLLAAPWIPGDPADLFIGAPQATGKGYVAVFAGGETFQYTLSGHAAGDQLGSAIAVGRFDGAHPGLALGAPGHASGAGQVSVYEQRTSPIDLTTLATLDGNVLATTSDAGDHFGSALAVGDFNRDGIDDLVVGVPDDAAGGFTHQGAVILFRGGGTGMSAAWRKIEQATGGAAGDRFGATLATGRFADVADDVSVVGGDYDVRNDSLIDLAIGAPGRDVGATDSGGLQVFLGEIGVQPVFTQDLGEATATPELTQP